MTGELRQTSFAEVKERRGTDQSSLTAFGGGSNETFIAVVQAPNDTGIDELCDEWMQELGMPRFLLEQFWSKRSAYRSNPSISNAHNAAFDEVELHDKYVSYLYNDDDAQDAIDEIIERLTSDENITLVCFEGDGKKCHRHILMDMIEREMPRFELEV